MVAPGSLVEQWQEELSDKFGLRFDLLTRDQVAASLTGNPFVEGNRLIMRLDMASRSDELQAKLKAARIAISSSAMSAPHVGVSLHGPP